MNINYNTGSVVGQTIYNKTFTDNSGGGGLYYNTSYTYVITPYNHNSLTGNTYTYTTYTLPTLNYLINGNLTTTSAELIFDGSFSYVSIYNYGSLLVTNYTSKVYVDTNVIPDFSYNYTVVPYNTIDFSGQQLTIDSYTAAIVRNIFVGNSTATSNQLIIDGSFNYYNLYYTDGTPVTNATGISARYFVDDSGGFGLIPDASYGYYAVPYNLISVSGDTSSLVVAYTLPTLNVTNTTTYNSITMNFTGLYYYVDISYADGNVVATNISANSYTDNSGGLGLFSNYLYSYVITPYDIG